MKNWKNGGSTKVGSMPPLSMLGILMPMLAMLIGGCVSTETDIRIKKDGSGTLTMRYSISNELLMAGVFDHTDPVLPIPIHRRDFERAVMRIEGLSLTSYRRRERADVISIRIRLRFDSIEAFNQFYYPHADALQRDGQGYRLLLYRPPAPLTAPEVSSGVSLDVSSDVSSDAAGKNIDTYLSSIDELAADAQIMVTLRIPHQIDGVNIGTVRGKKGTVMLPLAELLRRSDSLWWEIR